MSVKRERNNQMLDILPTELIRKISNNISDISDMYNARLSSKLICDSISNVKLTKGRLQHKITNRHKHVKDFTETFSLRSTIKIDKCLNSDCYDCGNRLSRILYFRKAHDMMLMRELFIVKEIIYDLPYCCDCLVDLYPNELWTVRNGEDCY